MPSTEQRSQPLLRLPKNQTPALITMHDGERSQVFLFVAPGASLTHYMSEGTRFLPIGFASGTRLISRDAIAALSIHVLHAPVEDELPGERQVANVRLRSGAVVKGELRWVAPEGQRRTLDFMNDDSTFFAVHDTEHVIYVAKAHVASVEEA
jgi:hypothetical protein